MHLEEVKKNLVAAKAIIENVIPQLEDIAEYSKNELRSANLILNEALASLKTNTTVHIIQYEHGGIPQEPFLFMDDDKAFEKFEELVIDQGFRKRRNSESRHAFEAAYAQALEAHIIQVYDSCPGLKNDDNVRWWTFPITEL